MADILFVTMDAGGNVQPMLGVAQAVAAMGHDIRVVGHESLRAEASRYGVDLIAYRSVRQWDSLKVQSPLRWPQMLNDRRIGDEVRELCETRRPDVAVVDCLLAPAHHVVRELGVSRVVFTHTFREYADHMRQLRRLGGGSPAAFYGYRLGALWNSASANLVATHRALDPASRRTQPANVEWTGVVLPEVVGPAASSASNVLVSMSTNGFPGQDRTLRRIVQALGDLPVQATVTTGGVFDPSAFDAPDNVTITGYADHLTLMPQCSLLIGHGGHSTTMRALAHGMPVLVIPASAFLDQRMIGRALRTAGVGNVLPRWSSAAAIRRAVQTLLDEEDVRRRAAALGAELRAEDGARRAAEKIDALVATRGVDSA